MSKINAGITVEAHPDNPDRCVIEYPSGHRAVYFNGERGLPVPPPPAPPRVGPLGLSEAETREVAGWALVQSNLLPAFINACRACVEQWDAEDAARADEPRVYQIELTGAEAATVLDWDLRWGRVPTAIARQVAEQRGES